MVWKQNFKRKLYLDEVVRIIKDPETGWLV